LLFDQFHNKFGESRVRARCGDAGETHPKFNSAFSRFVVKIPDHLKMI